MRYYAVVMVFNSYMTDDLMLTWVSVDVASNSWFELTEARPGVRVEDEIRGHQQQPIFDSSRRATATKVTMVSQSSP
jgi:hypothetical protein